MNVKVLTKHHLEFLGLKGSCTGSSESTFVKMPHCLKSHVTAHITNAFVRGDSRNGERTPDRDFRCFYPCGIFLSHIQTHTRSSGPYVSSLLEKSVPHRYPCEISVTNTR